MKNGTSKAPWTNLHLVLLLLRKTPQVLGQRFCRVKNIVSPDRYLDVFSVACWLFLWFLVIIDVVALEKVTGILGSPWRWIDFTKRRSFFTRWIQISVSLCCTVLIFHYKMWRPFDSESKCFSQSYLQGQCCVLATQKKNMAEEMNQIQQLQNEVSIEPAEPGYLLYMGGFYILSPPLPEV